MNRPPRQPGAPGEARLERGSAIVMGLFVLTLLTGLGTALLFLSQHEARMSQTGLRAKEAFFLAESGIEDARVTLFLANGNGPFTDDLLTAAGDGVIDFDPDTIEAVYDTDGNVTGFQGYGNDVPLRAITTVSSTEGGGGAYIAFLTNDPIEGRTTTADGNDRVMLTAVGAGSDRSIEIVQAILEPYQFLPDAPAAAMTLLGPLPSFDNGNSSAQAHTGDDCGVPGGAYAPIVGTVDGASRTQVQGDMNRPETFDSGPTTGPPPAPFEGTETVADLTDSTDPIVAEAGHGTIDPDWTDCETLKQSIIVLQGNADHYCNSDLGACSLPATTAPDEIVFIDGDLSGTPAGSFTGILVVTGELTYNGNTGWDGILMIVGEGTIERSGGGANDPSGALVVASIDPTPNGPRVDKSDWCTTPPDGFQQAIYNTTGAGTSTVQWCTNHSNAANSIRKYRVVEFLQR